MREKKNPQQNKTKTNQRERKEEKNRKSSWRCKSYEAACNLNKNSGSRIDQTPTKIEIYTENVKKKNIAWILQYKQKSKMCFPPTPFEY